MSDSFSSVFFSSNCHIISLAAQEPQGYSKESEDSLQRDSVIMEHPDSQLSGFCKPLSVHYFILNQTFSYQMVGSCLWKSPTFFEYDYLINVLFDCSCWFEPTISSSSLCQWGNHTFLQYSKPWWRLYTRTKWRNGKKLYMCPVWMWCVLRCPFHSFFFFRNVNILFIQIKVQRQYTLIQLLYCASLAILAEVPL